MSLRVSRPLRKDIMVNFTYEDFTATGKLCMCYNYNTSTCALPDIYIHTRPQARKIRMNCKPNQPCLHTYNQLIKKLFNHLKTYNQTKCIFTTTYDWLCHLATFLYHHYYKGGQMTKPIIIIHSCKNTI